MNTKKFAIGTLANGYQFYFILGDTVWYHENANEESDPAIAVIVAINEESMCDLQVMAQSGAVRNVRRGVCLTGDSRLNQAPYRAKGCWKPRPTPHEIHALMNPQVAQG